MWGRIFTIVSFFAIYALCFYWTKYLKDEMFTIHDGLKAEEQIKMLQYVDGAVYPYFVGLTWFRVWKRRNFFVTATHALIIAYATYKQIEALKYFHDKTPNKEKFYRNFVLELYSLFLTIMQFLLSIHLIMVRYGKSPAERSFRSGLHSYFGTLIFIGLWFTLIQRIHLFPGPFIKRIENERISDTTLYTVVAFLPWMFVLVNPYFEWRRLYVMFYNDPVEKKKEEQSKLGYKKGGAKSSEKSLFNKKLKNPFKL